MLLQTLGSLSSFMNQLMPSFEDNYKITNSKIKEKGSFYYFDVSLPEISRQDISVKYNDGMLILTVIKSTDTSFNSYSGNFYLKKQAINHYSKKFYIGKNVRASDIKTTFKNGLLRIAFPKSTQYLIEK